MTDLFSVKNNLLSLLDPTPLNDKSPNDFTLVVEGQQVVVMGGRVTKAIDTCADGWTAIVRWDPNDAEMSELLRPYGYQKTETYLGPDIVINGVMPTTKNVLTSNSRFKELHGFSLPYDIVDSSIKPPFEQTKVTLKERAKTLTADFPFSIKFDLENDEPFDRATAKSEETIFSHLLDLTRQRGGLISSTSLGELHFLKANTSGSPVASLVENFPPGTNYSVEFDGRRRFNEYRAMAQSPGRKKKNKSKLKVASAFDPIVPEFRYNAFEADESNAGNLQQAADWRRSKTLADALTFPYPVSSWYTPDGELWRENTIVTIESAILGVPDGFNFLIRQVEYIFSRDMTSAILSIVPPQAYTGEDIVEPWGIQSPGFLEGLF